MSTSASTSNNDTGIRPAPTSPARSRFDPDGDYRPDAAGRSYMNDSTETETTDTCINDDCSLEFIISATDRHPSKIICTTHGWSGEVTEDA